MSSKYDIKLGEGNQIGGMAIGDGATAHGNVTVGASSNPTSAARPGDSSTTAKPTQGIRIFLSHSAKDEKLAAALIRCLEDCLEVPDGTIRCTSVPGYKLAPGDVSDEVLRDNLEQCSVVIGLLTEESLKSGYVVMELGAAWGLKKTTCAVLAPGIGFDRIPGPLARRHAIKADDGNGITSLMEVVGQKASLTDRSRSRFVAGVNAFAAAAKASP